VNPREKFLNTIHGKNYGTPVFCPAVYDYKVNFAHSPPQLFGQDEPEFVDAVEKEIRALDSEVVTCGYDIYNIEAESVGSVVDRNKMDMLPEITHPLIKHLDDIHLLPTLKEPVGRMVLFIQATKYLSHKFHNKVYVRGAASGPFSMAGKIYGNEKLILECMINPEGVCQLLEYCTDIIITYIKGYVDVGQDVVIFDSLASPPLISSAIYDDLIFPFHQKIYQFMIKRGIQIRPLIIGGNTLPIMEKLTATGANQLLLDFVIPIKDMLPVLERHDLAFRINLNPYDVAHNNPHILMGKMDELFKTISHSPNILVGTGILSKDTPIGNIRLIRDRISAHYQKILK